MNSGLMSHQQQGHMEKRSQFKVSSERQVRRDPWICSLACYPLHHRPVKWDPWIGSLACYPLPPLLLNMEFGNCRGMRKFLKPMFCLNFLLEMPGCLMEKKISCISGLNELFQVI